jgi:hypothetical protein
MAAVTICLKTLPINITSQLVAVVESLANLQNGRARSNSRRMVGAEVAEQQGNEGGGGRRAEGEWEGWRAQSSRGSAERAT